ncbi:MAG TPA: AAA family ATPase [Verrucomicrobiae bacterium]
MNPPSDINDWIGLTRRIAHIMGHKVKEYQSDPAATDKLLPFEKCHLFVGPPGIGKSGLAKQVAYLIAPYPGGVENLNGSSLTVDVARRWTNDRYHLPMFGDFSVKLIDELDGTPDVACNQMRTFLDYLPRRTIILGTTNKPVEELQSQYQSRFKVWHFEAPALDEVTQLLMRRNIPADTASKIADATKGNVRAALADASSFLDMQRYDIAA